MTTKQLPNRVAIIGAGAMGGNIALTFARAGVSAALVDASLDRALASRDQVRATATGYAEDGLFSDGDAARVEELVSAATLEDALAGANFVVEAVSESEAVKAQVYRQIESVVDERVVIATNTSAIPIGDLAKSLRHPERFLGTHWFLPAAWVPCVEIVPSADTQTEIVERVSAWHAEIGKHPVVVSDSVGFVGNRLQFALFAEAARIVDEGLASPRQIDEVVRSSFGYRLPFFGPFTIADMAGLDVYSGAYEVLQRDLGERFAPPAIVAEAVKQGRLGVKTGAGLLEWDDAAMQAIVRKRDRQYADLHAIWSRTEQETLATAASSN